MVPPPIPNGMSIDVEDWFQVGAFETAIDRSDWDGFARRVGDNTRAALDLFDRCDIRATFFTLGWVAEREGPLMREIVERGHELASHGYDHARIFTFDEAAFARDVDRARGLLEDASGVAITGYRAPSFSLDARTPWAHPILADRGYRYSSSVAPVVHDHYGWVEAPRFAFRPLVDTDLIEVPVTTAKLGNRRLAAGGGGFFRVLPYAFTRWAIRQVNGEGYPAIFYFHPWEIDPDQPRVHDAPLRSRIRHYTKLGVMEVKLAALLREFAWDRMDRIVDRLQPEAERIAA